MKEFWSPDDHHRIKKAADFEMLGTIALEVLERMAVRNVPIVEICGPMSTGGFGNLDANMRFFNIGIERAIEQGVFVFDQLPFQVGMFPLIQKIKQEKGPGYCTEILEIFYRKIFESGHIKKTLFLPGWKTSHGATWERKLVGSLSIAIEEYPVEWLEGVELPPAHAAV